MSESVAEVESLAIVAHELRNPIGAIRNAVSVMESAGSLPGAMDQARRLIARQTGQLSALVDSLLDLASLSRGTLSLRRERVDIVPEVEAAVESCAWAIAASGHSLCLEVPDAPLYAYVDAPRLRQVVANLLDNAGKYTPAFGRVRVSLTRIGNYAVCNVEDNGVGIASEYLPFVFDLFSRSDSSRAASARGLGVGLALVREIAELHGGDVRVNSAGVGQGSAFIVRVPVCE